MDLVSILIPCYNHENYINDCLNSIITQTYSEIELLIIDDCSTDDSFNILKSWEKKLKYRFRNVYIDRNTTNQGIVKTLNKMLTLANGKYIKWIASDDMLLSNAIENLLEFAHKGENDIIFSNVAFIKTDTTYPVIIDNSFRIYYQTLPPIGKNLTGILCGRNFIATPGSFVPKKTFDRFGFFDETYIFEDWEFWLRVSINGNFGYLDCITALYRENNSSLSHFEISESGKKRQRLLHQNKQMIFKKYQSYANNTQQTQFFNQELRVALSLDDVSLANEINSEMKAQHFLISLDNKIRWIFTHMHLYFILRKIKMFLTTRSIKCK